MAVEQPVITIIHGAFHPPVYYRKLIQPLRESGYIVIAPALPSTGLDDSITDKTYVDDVKRIHESLIPLLDQGKEAVVVCHSQGGIAGSALLEGQTVEERKTRGLNGGIKAIIYISAFALPEKGMSLISSIGGSPAGFYAQKASQMVVNEKAAMAFYNMMPESQHPLLIDSLVYQSAASQYAEAHFVAADVTVPKTYVVCSEDGAIPAAGQRAWAEMTGCRVVEIKSDHSPFLRDENTREVLDIIYEVAAS